MMGETVEGMQESGVQATAKHWILNEQELQRETMSADAGGRVVRELYAWPFQDAVRSGVAAVMCRYVLRRLFGGRERGMCADGVVVITKSMGRGPARAMM